MRCSACSTVGMTSPASTREIYDWLVPARNASASWLSRPSRNRRSSSPNDSIPEVVSMPEMVSYCARSLSPWQQPNSQRLADDRDHARAFSKRFLFASFDSEEHWAAVADLISGGLRGLGGSLGHALARCDQFSSGGGRGLSGSTRQGAERPRSTARLEFA